MEDNKKMEQLLQIIEHPQDFSEQQKDDILSDEECRRLYDRLVEVRKAMASKQVSDCIPNVVEEWNRFRRERIFQGYRVWRVAVAVGITLLVVSGVAFAVFHPQLFRGSLDGTSEQQAVASVSHQTMSFNTMVPEERDSVLASRRYIYDDVPLQKILDDVAEVYHISVKYARPAVRNIRLYMQWNSGQELEEVIALMNHFENVQLLLNEDTIIVK